MCKCVQNCVGDCCKPAVAKPTAHPHAALMAQYAEDALTTDKPWELWQVKCPEMISYKGNLPDSEGFIMVTGGSPSWHTDNEYRRKPRTININGHEVPEPLRQAIVGVVYYVPSLLAGREAFSVVFEGSVGCITRLNSGLLHTTKEAAILHAKALLSFTEVK